MNLRPGRYACEVTAPSNGWFGEAGDKATPFIRIPLVVTEGNQQGQEETYQAWISDSAYARTIKNLKEVFEWDGDMVTLAKQTNEGHFVGRPCSIVVEEEEYKGKKRNVIKWLNGPTGDSMMEVNKALQLANRLMGNSQEEPDRKPSPPRTGYGQRPSTPPPKPPADPEFGDESDDIPF